MLGDSRPEWVRQRMILASWRGQKEPAPGRYYWHHVWWALHARECLGPAALQYSANMLALYRDMLANPQDYRRVGTIFERRTHWQVFQYLLTNRAKDGN